MESESREPVTISIIIPSHNARGTLKRCLEAVQSSTYKPYEVIVVDDGSTDDSVEIGKSYGAHVIELERGPSGPANARNQGAQAAGGEFLFFIDADVVIRPDTLQEMAGSFARSPEIAAVFGSYDETPGDGRFLSQYKNLFHHFVHQRASENASTFWSGCGAVRRDVFFQVGGFDTLKYPRPSIEDIELGRRIKAAGYTIFVNKVIQVKHLKRWTLTGLIKTDVFDRAIPWTLLIISEQAIPNDLNLEGSQRLSALFTAILLIFVASSALYHSHVFLLPFVLGLFWVMLRCWQWREQPVKFYVGWRSFLTIIFLIGTLSALIFYFGLTSYFPPLLVLLCIVIFGPWLARRGRFWQQAIFALMLAAIATGMLLVVTSYPLWLSTVILVIFGIFLTINRRFYAFFTEKRGIMFAIAVIPFHMLYYLYSLVAFAIATMIHYGRAGRALIKSR